jgi:hypothetical protein
MVQDNFMPSLLNLCSKPGLSDVKNFAFSALGDFSMASGDHFGNWIEATFQTIFN